MGSTPRLRRVACGATGLALLASLTACTGAARDERPRQAAPPRVEVQSCQALLDQGWQPPLTDPAFDVDPATGITEVSFDADNTLTVDPVGDPVCGELPGIGGPLSRTVSQYDEIRQEECADSVSDVNAGRAPTKGEVVGSLDALRHYVVEWCPPAFAAQLAPAATPPAPDRGGADGVRSCADLLARGWRAPSVEPQLTYDPTSGVVEVMLPRRTLRLDLRNDPACLDLPTYGPLLERLLKEAEGFAG